MKFSASLCIALVSSATADSYINDLETNGKKEKTVRGFKTELEKIDAHVADKEVRTLAGHSACNTVALDEDDLVERYGMNISNPEHVYTLTAALNGDLQLGSITQNIAEGNDAGRVGALVKDGYSGDENFPHGHIKPILTVGEINMCDENTGDVYVGVPDGMGAYLKDDKTLRIVVQSESYGQLRYESYPYFVNQGSSSRKLGVGSRSGGASFTGSHVQYVDLDRDGLSHFMGHAGPASDIITGFGQVAHTYYNLAGDLVGSREGGGEPHYSNTDKDGNWAMEDTPSEADWLMQSLCSAHLEEKHQWGDGIGFEDDIYITNEEWITYAEGAEYVGISMHAIDLANGVDYAVGAVTVSGFEKIVEINPQHKDYVVLSISGYNGAYNNGDAEIDARNKEYNGTRADGKDWVNPENVCPARIYIGMKGKMEDGSDAPADDFLARNGLRYGKVYGFATDMDVSADAQGLWRDVYHKCRPNGSKVDGKFVAIDWQWDGTVKNFRHDGAWDFQTDVPGYGHEGSLMKWWNGAGYDNSGSKTEHNSPDTRPGKTAFIQGSTAGYFGHYYVNDLLDALKGDEDFPAEVDATYYVYQGENDISGQIDLGGEGLYNKVEQCFNNADATKNCDADYSIKYTFEDIDGLEVVAAKEGLFAVIQEDSGNDLGERMFITSVLEHEDDGEEIMYYFMAQSGGKYNTRMKEYVGIPATASTSGNAHEFSGVIDLSGMLQKGNRRMMKAAKKESQGDKKVEADMEFLISAGDGEAKRMAEHEISINDKIIALGLQAHNFNSGVIEALKADRGGQLLVYQPKI